MQRPRLISPLNLAGFVGAVLVVMVLLYPRQRIYQQIREDVQVDETSIQYILNLLATEPGNHELRLHLARSYIKLGQYQNAFLTLQPLFASSELQWREKAWLLKLDIMLKQVFAEAPGSAKRQAKVALFKTALLEAEAQFGSIDALRQLAKLAELGNELQIAEEIYARLLQGNENQLDLDEAARLALANGRYLQSAKYSWRSRKLATDADSKVRYLKLVMGTLQAGNIGHLALEWIQELPEAEWQEPDLLYRLTKLALASALPAQASSYAKKLFGFDGTETTSPGFNADHAEIAYSAFLGSGEMPYGLRLAQMAVRQLPQSVLWHERLAQVGEWSGNPQIAIEAWRWLALNRAEESDWKAWMRLADALFDYKAQIVGLEREWHRNGHKEKTVRQIIQLYENLGQPEDAVAWLDKNGDVKKHPELVLLAAELLVGMGKDSDAIERYRRYLKWTKAPPAVAVTIAALMQRMGLYQEAFDALVRNRPQARAEDKLFWINLAELSWILKRYDQAEFAYRTLSDAPDADYRHQLRLYQVLKQNNAALAARTAEQYWLKSGHIELFMSAVDALVELKDWKAVYRLYKMTDAPKWREYDSNLRFVSIRAEMHKNLGNVAAAERDYRFLAKNYPGDAGIKESYLWLLVDTHNLNQLDVLMQRWERLLPSTPNLLDVFAAGHLSLGRPNQAVILYDQMAKTRKQDELWLINYAATLEATGQLSRAEKVRGQVWKNRKEKAISIDAFNSPTNAKEIERLRLLLASDPALGQSVLWKLLRDGSPELTKNAQFVELASAWLNDHEQNDASRVWLIRQYARRLNTNQGSSNR